MTVFEYIDQIQNALLDFKKYMILDNLSIIRMAITITCPLIFLGFYVCSFASGAIVF